MKNPMKIVISIMVCLFLVVAVGTTSALAQSDDAAIQQALDHILLDQSLLEEGTAATPAWLGYAFARLGWLKENMPGPVSSESYQKAFEEELYGRESLAKIWDELKEKNPEMEDTYLDELVMVYKAGYLTEYVWIFTYYETWDSEPTDERIREFAAWFDETMPEHKPQTLASLVWESR